MAAVAFPNYFSKWRTKLQSLYKGITNYKGNTKTITVVFQFAKIEHYSTIFQRHISLKSLCEN